VFNSPLAAFEAYLLAQNGTVDIIDTFLAFVKPDCTSFQPNESPITPADIPFSDGDFFVCFVSKVTCSLKMLLLLVLTALALRPLLSLPVRTFS
jgi:hypothetical protein